MPIVPIRGGFDCLAKNLIGRKKLWRSRRESRLEGMELRFQWESEKEGWIMDAGRGYD